MFSLIFITFICCTLSIAQQTSSDALAAIGSAVSKPMASCTAAACYTAPFSESESESGVVPVEETLRTGRVIPTSVVGTSDTLAITTKPGRPTVPLTPTVTGTPSTGDDVEEEEPTATAEPTASATPLTPEEQSSADAAASSSSAAQASAISEALKDITLPQGLSITL